MYQTIEVERSGAIASVVLDRPDVRNAFDAQMIGELTELFARLGGEPDLRAVLLKGRGSSFSAGADANWMRSSLEFSQEENFADAIRMSDMFAAIDSCPVPVIGCVQGAALGGGMGLLAVCDIVVAAQSTIFGFTECKLGIAPAVISRFVVPKIGQGWARALYLTGERFGSEVARDIGLVHWISPDEQLDQVVDQKVHELLSSGPQAVKQAKRLIVGVLERDPDERREYTAERIAALRASPEGQEGLRAFLEKRTPSWVPSD